MEESKRESGSSGRSGKPVGATLATLAVIRFACGAQGAFRLAEVARSTGLNRSTAFNILRTLADDGVLAFAPATKDYTLTDQLPRLVRGLDLLAPDRLQRLQKAMTGLAELYGVSVAFWTIRGDDLVLSAVAEGGAEIRLTQELGRTVPLLYGAAGRAVAAALSLSDNELSRLLPAGADQCGLNSFKADLDRARRRGWADDGGSLQAGVKAIAVPVLSAGNDVQGACATLMLRGQFSASEERAIASALHRVVQSL